MSYDDKANVSIDADGNVLRCAKGASAGECGFVKGAEICAKCGALPMAVKIVPSSDDEMMEEEDDEVMDAENSKKLKKKEDMAMEDDMDMMEDEEEDDEDMESPSGKGSKMRKKGSMMSMGGMMDNEDEDEEMMIESSKKKMKTKKKQVMDMDEEDDDSEMDDEDMDEEDDASDENMSDDEMADEDMDEEDMDEEDMDEEEDEEDEESMEMGEKAFSPLDQEWEEIRRSRIKSMGMKTADLGALGYVCALERKAYPGSSPVCADCPGGCVAEKGLPGLLHVEGLAEKMFNGYVLDSGYSSDADMFVIDVQTKDGAVKEVFVDGTTAEVLGFHRLDKSEFEQKSLEYDYKLIDFTEAAEIAVKAVDGHVVAVEPDIFEGFDSYAVEIDGFDGKSYDVFVGLDGEILGLDRYELHEAEEIEAEAAELAIKRAFSEERRMELAESGMALPDGSYPIVTESDLRNAIQAFGRAKDKDAAKRHIMKRARAMKLESLIPASWVAGASEKSENGVPNDAEFIASLVEFQLLEDQLDDK